MSIEAQHAPWSDLVDVTKPFVARWLPAVDVPPDGWHLYRSGEFPVLVDAALREPEETPRLPVPCACSPPSPPVPSRRLLCSLLPTV